MGSKDHPLLEFSLWLDLISLSMRAGLDFKSAIHLMTENESESASKTANEFQLLLSDLRVGKSKSEALQAFAARWHHHPLIDPCCQTLLYGLKQGVSISDLLEEQAETMRHQLFFELERKMQKKPFKLLLPLFLLILPATLTVLMLPIFLQLFRDGF